MKRSNDSENYLSKKIKNALDDCGPIVSKKCIICNARQGLAKLTNHCHSCHAFIYKSDFYKFKETYIIGSLKQLYGSLSNNSKYMGYYLHRKPSCIIQASGYYIIIEVDYRQYFKNNPTYTFLREMQIYKKIQSKLLVFIYFNPDSYVVNDKTISSCFSHKQNNSYSVNLSSYSSRRDKLYSCIMNAYSNKPTKEITTNYLFYSN